mgnify:CR=1 FL=1
MYKVFGRNGICFFFFQAEDGIRDYDVTGVQTCALPIYWLAKLVDTPTLRVVGARHACAWMIRNFEQLERTASEQLDRLKIDVDRLVSNLRRAGLETAADPIERTLIGVNSKVFQDLFEFATAMLRAVSYRHTNLARQALREVLLVSERRLRGLSRNLQALADEFPKSTDEIPVNLTSTPSRQYPSSLMNGLPQLVATLDQVLERTHLGQLLVKIGRAHV